MAKDYKLLLAFSPAQETWAIRGHSPVTHERVAYFGMVEYQPARNYGIPVRGVIPFAADGQELDVNTDWPLRGPCDAVTDGTTLCDGHDEAVQS